MTYFRHATSDDITLQLRLWDPSTMLGITGAAPTVQIRRHRASQGGALLDNYYWNGTIFTSTPTTLPMSEFDDTNDAGLYLYFFDQTLVGTNQIYLVRFEQATGVAKGFVYEQHLVTDEISIPVSVPSVPVSPGDTVMGRLADMENANGPVNQATTDALLGEIIAPHAAIPGSVAEAIASCAALNIGSSMVTITVEDQATNPISGAQVDIYDSTNTHFLGRVNTDILGQVVVALDDDTYSVRLFASGYSFTVPEALVVSGTTSETFTGTGQVSIPPPSAPDLCVIFGTNMTDAGGNDLVGACVEAYASTPQVVDGRQIGDPVASTTTDQDGNFTLELVRNTEVRFTIEDAGIDSILTVPDAASQDVATWT